MCAQGGKGFVKVWRLIVCLLCLALSARASSLSITRTDQGLRMKAVDADLYDILARIQDLSGIRLDTASISNRTISASYRPMPVDELLARLGVNFVLYYERPEGNDDYKLAGGSLFEGIGEGMNSALLQRILEHIRNLHDDEIPFNALESMNALYQLGDEAIPVLEQTLSTGDYQAQQMSAQILSWLGDRYPASDRFLEVLIEGLKDDDFPGGYNHATGERLPYTHISNARTGLEYFRRHPDAVNRMEGRLAGALDSDDGQQRLIAASLLASAGKSYYTDRLVRVLAPHLADNSLSSDGAIAYEALIHLGTVARPALAATLEHADAQQTEYINRMFSTWDRGYRSTQPYYPPASMHDWVPENFPDRDGNYRIPKVVEDDAPFRYTVGPGDTYESIARAFLIPVDSVRIENGVRDPAEVPEPGTSIIVPWE